MATSWRRHGASPVWWSLAAAAVYAVVAFVYFGLRIVARPGHQLVGYGGDPQIFVWALGWLPHAIVHGENPFSTQAVWAPQGLNLAWHTTVPGLALALAPLTAVAGPAVAYDVAAVLMPAAAAWTAFALCRHLTGAFWPSLVGGYVFGFSTYVVAQTEGHLHMTAVFALPLVALVVLRYVEEELTGAALVARLGPLLAFEVLVSTEVAFTLTLALATALAAAYAVVPARRARLRSSVRPVLLSGVLAAVLASPYLYYALTGFHSASLHPGDVFDTDLLNFVVPTHDSLASLGWSGVARSFPGNDSERDAYLGVPVVLILALYLWERRRSSGGRFLLVCLGLSCLASLGAHLYVHGERLIPLPWSLLDGLPAFDNVLPSRLAVYVSLAAAAIVALWTAARRPGLLRWALPAAAVVALAPNPGAGVWATDYSLPPFFTSAAYRDCLDPGATVLPLPVGLTGEPLLWQAAAGYRFEMAGGDLGLGPPPSFLDSPAASLIGKGYHLDPSQAGLAADFIRSKGVSAVVVDKAEAGFWSGALDRIVTPLDVGGVLLYRVGPTPPACPAP